MLFQDVCQISLRSINQVVSTFLELYFISFLSYLSNGVANKISSDHKPCTVIQEPERVF